MLVDHLLFAIGHQHHHEAVIARDDPAELEAVHQKQRYRNFLLAARPGCLVICQAAAVPPESGRLLTDAFRWGR